MCDCLVAAYPTDRVWNASALLVQLAEQLEGLPRHARRLAPADLSQMADFVA